MDLSSITAIRNLAELHSKFQPDKMNFNPHSLLQAAAHMELQGTSSDMTSTESYTYESGEPVNAEIFDYRGEKLAGFRLNGKDMICLPQAYELFLKNLVGGLHTVYTKLKRLEILPLVCNVEQVRALRSLGAIQPGVNRCKLISTCEFDTLHDDCTNSARPGRPAKRLNMEEWSAAHKHTRLEEELASSSSSTSSLMSPFLGQFLTLPQLTAQQMLMQHMMGMAVVQQQQHVDRREEAEEMRASPSEQRPPQPDQPGPPAQTTSIDELVKNQQANQMTIANSETSDSDSLESMLRKDEDARTFTNSCLNKSMSPNQSMSDRGMSGSGSGSNISSTNDQASTAITKIISLIDMANEHFRQQRDLLQKDREEVDRLRREAAASQAEERKMLGELREERRKARIAHRKFCAAKREIMLLRERQPNVISTNGVNGSGSAH